MGRREIRELERREELEKVLSFGEHYGGLMAFLDCKSREFSQEEALDAAAKEFYRNLPYSDPHLLKHLVLSINQLIERYEDLPATIKEGGLKEGFYRGLANIKNRNPRCSELHKLLEDYLLEKEYLF